jgi:hypothetical protein
MAVRMAALPRVGAGDHTHDGASGRWRWDEVVLRLGLCEGLPCCVRS